MQADNHLDKSNNQLDAVHRLLIQRGLRFTFWQFMPGPFSGPRSSLVWVCVGNLTFWLIMFTWGEARLPVTLFGSVILVLLQLASILLMLLLERAVRFLVSVSVIAKLPRPLKELMYLLITMFCAIGMEASFLWVGFSVTLMGMHNAVLDTWTTEMLSFRLKDLCELAILVAPMYVGSVILLSLETLPKPLSRQGVRWIGFLLLNLIFVSVYAFLLNLVGGSLLRTDSFSILGLALALMSLNSVLSLPLTFASWLGLSGLAASVSMLPNLVKIRANVLSLTTLAATIPFLNADSWQLVTGMGWSEMVAAAGLVYCFPILLLTLSQRELIRRRLYKGWKPSKEVKLSKLLETSQALGFQFDDEIKERIDAGLNITKMSTRSDALLVTLKNVTKLVLFLALAPLSICVFVLLLFNLVISEQVLLSWLQGFSLPQLFVKWGFSIEPLMMLKIKAAGLLALLSVGSTLVTLLTSENEMKAFIDDAFVHDIRQDKHLLTLYRALKQGLTSLL